MLLYVNEYQMAQAVYTFHGDSKLWLENITRAQVRLAVLNNHAVFSCCLLSLL